MKRNTVQLDAAKAQILDRWISLTVGTEVFKKKMIKSRSHRAGYLKHYFCNVLYLFPCNQVRFLGFCFVGWLFWYVEIVSSSSNVIKNQVCHRMYQSFCSFFLLLKCNVLLSGTSVKC